ncbi:MAG: DUF2927 domain-containing protein [Silicimonas sp.]|nr:DUF2927 domain-containing protein [Silicimonas sp.]
MRRLALGLALAALTACAAEETDRRSHDLAPLPPMQLFPTRSGTEPLASNAMIARDFLDLSFQLESGQTLPRFTRFEGPITIATKGRLPGSLNRDLDALLTRLKREADLDIRRAGTADTASIVIQAIPLADLQRAAPNAACIVRPNVTSWSDFRARRNAPDTQWQNLTERRQLAVFLPADEPPQEIRDCLHEEIAQALGPVNDLFRLSESIFNDDNFHSVLTGHDMLILRATYDARLQSGMTRAQVAARLPEILARLNPAGGRAGIAPPAPARNAWTRTITTAMDNRLPRERRRLAAERAVSMAAIEAGTPAQMGLSYFWLGRLSLARHPDRALTAFLAAHRIYQSRPELRVQSAQAALQLAAYQLSTGRSRAAIKLVDDHLAVARASENAVLLSQLLFVKAEALRLDDRIREAGKVQRDALAWARYGFGSDTEVRNRAAEILAISPRSRQSGDAV